MDISKGRSRVEKEKKEIDQLFYVILNWAGTKFQGCKSCNSEKEMGKFWNNAISDCSSYFTFKWLYLGTWMPCQTIPSTVMCQLWQKNLGASKGQKNLGASKDTMHSQSEQEIDSCEQWNLTLFLFRTTAQSDIF